MKAATRCVHHETNDYVGAVVPPIYQTATFRQPTALESGEYDYTRTANPTRSVLERQLAALEGGAYATAFASGMAALTALTRLVEAGEEIIAGDDLYVGTVRLLDQILSRQRITVRYGIEDVDDLIDDLDQAFKAAIGPRLKAASALCTA
jgi:cystathionine beta-lyase